MIILIPQKLLWLVVNWDIQDIVLITMLGVWGKRISLKTSMICITKLKNMFVYVKYIRESHRKMSFLIQILQESI